MRLGKLEDAIVRADAEWFVRAGFITEGTKERVLRWLDGAEDKEIQHIVAGWLEHDADWIDKVEHKSMRHFWYIVYAVGLEAAILKRRLRKRARELKL